ncbi:MAG: DUF1223 domain-containing protein [Alphaproteobacteria bacterium]|nr:DUF1223 domain-containing protein [Alphaproteobacteria bacterium]
MKYILAIFASLVSSTAVTEEAPSSKVVVELYTSQGCSSCPPADKVLEELSHKYEKLVLPLSFHVDYWNYIGWEDPFSSKENTKRQRGYQKLSGRSSIYTPQTVINGKREMVGSHKNKVFTAVHTEAKMLDERPDVTLIQNAKDISVSIGAGKGSGDIIAVEYTPHERTDVLRGENRNRKLSNVNIVDKFYKVGTWDGSAQRFNIPKGSSKGYAILIQKTGQRQIISANNL